MSRFGSKTYNRKNECKTMQLEHLLTEKGNKPSTAKVSVAAVHRWGMTSFTSLRKTHVNGQKDGPPPQPPAPAIKTQVKRIKLEPKQHTDTFSEDPFGFETEIVETKKPPAPVKVEKKPSAPKPNKFFKSGSRKNAGLAAGSNSSKNSDFDALRMSVPQNYYPIKIDEDLNIQTSNKNGNSLYEKSSRLFESLVQSKPVHIQTLQVQAPIVQEETFIQSTMNAPLQMSYPEQTPKQQPFFSVDPMNNSENMSLNLVFHGVTPECIKSTDYSNSVIPNCRTFDENKLPSVLSNSVSGDVFLTPPSSQDSRNKNLIHGPPDIVATTCDQNTDPKLETVIEETEVVPSTSSSQSDLYSCDEKESSQETFFDSTELIVNELQQQQQHQSKIKSIPRSKKIFNSSKKPKAVYNPRHWQSLKQEEEILEEDITEKQSVEKTASLASEFDDFQNDEIHDVPPVKEVKKIDAVGDPTNSIKSYKPVKQLYTVVKNVKQAYQCHESGETQEFNDDIEYLLEGLQGTNGVGTRCLSILSLATKCMGAAFRVHLRAHGTMPKIFSALQDVPSDPNMSLCTATLLFVLSQDRLTMDIEASTLSLMLQLLETDPESRNSEKDFSLILEDPALCVMQEKHREKVAQLCEQMQLKGHAKHLKLDNLNTGILAMETLLSLTSRKAGEWFKEEMRTLRGLDHIVDTITTCVESLIPEQNEIIFKPTESQVDKIRKVDRCLRVLENVSYMNFENQDYLLRYKNCLLINYCLSLMKLCKSHLLEHQYVEEESNVDELAKPKPLSPVLYCLLSVLKVLLNITFENSFGCLQVGAQKGMMENVLMCILQVPKSVPVDKRFDLLVLSLGLMINLVEHGTDNRKHFMEMYTMGSFDTPNDGYEILASEALVEVLLSRLEAAQQSEEQADELLSSQEIKQATTDRRDMENAASQAECLEETLMKTLQKAGKHMEHSIIAAYISLLLGCVIQNNSEYAESVRDHVPDGKFDVMIEVLKKFMSFVSLTGAVGNTGVKSIQRIIEVLNGS